MANMKCRNRPKSNTKSDNFLFYPKISKPFKVFKMLSKCCWSSRDQERATEVAKSPFFSSLRALKLLKAPNHLTLTLKLIVRIYKITHRAQ